MSNMITPKHSLILRYPLLIKNLTMIAVYLRSQRFLSLTVFTMKKGKKEEINRQDRTRANTDPDVYRQS